MCGIHVCVSTQSFKSPSDDLQQLLCSRGPDHTGESHVEIRIRDGPSYWISAFSTVLALRGDRTTVQPFVDPSSGSILCWNGEAWKIGSESIQGNDGQFLFELLMGASSAQKSITESTVAILRILHTISGPFAFVLVDKIHSQIYFGRDRLGRRSLLYEISSDPTSLHLSSVADPHNGSWQEVDTDAIYELSFEADPRLKSRDENYGLLSISFSSICRHLWEDHTAEGVVRTYLVVVLLSS
jgi:asparagine synthetase B (glutamine-hydrolysing)